MYDTHPEQDFPQHRLNVIVCSSDNDWQFVSAVHVIYVGQCQGGNWNAHVGNTNNCNTISLALVTVLHDCSKMETVPKWPVDRSHLDGIKTAPASSNSIGGRESLPVAFRWIAFISSGYLCLLLKQFLLNGCILWAHSGIQWESRWDWLRYWPLWLHERSEWKRNVQIMANIQVNRHGMRDFWKLQLPG